LLRSTEIDCIKLRLDCNFKGMRLHAIDHPFPPPLPEKCAADPSDIYQVVQRHSNYPPIIQTNTFRVSVPFKEQRHHRAPSESIGNNYSPKAQDLKIDKLTRQRPSRKSSATATGPKRKFHAPSSPSSPTQTKSKRRKTRIYRSPPMSPSEQLVIMHKQEETQNAQNEYSETDLERYTYYVKRGIPFYMLAPYPKQSMVNIKNMLPPEPEEGVKKPIRTLRNNLTEEVEDGYYFNLRKSIVDYILMDPSEGLRLTINNIPKPFPRRVIRPPVPWAVSYREAKLWQMQHLFNVCPFMGLLQQIWIERGDFDVLIFVHSQILLVKLQVKNSEIEFSPSFQECWEVIREAFMQIIRSLECKLFSDIDRQYLSTVRPDESLVTDILAQVEEAFQKNTVGPIRYLDLYEKYRNLLDNKSDEEISEFISSTHSLQDSKIDSIMRMWMKIASLRIAVPLSMFCLNARDLNDYLCDCANKLIARIVTFEMDENRRLNIE
uniref:Dynein heavy chain linker domain-containing protein n=1 Tax=Poecilia reticulata TaxID=8081 RepID=A0A3P9MWQ0_POERE